MADIVFTTRLTEADWDDNLRGWRCPPLAIPGATVEAVYVEGERIDTARYEALAQNGVIRWVFPDQPSRATASIALTEELTLGRDTARWKKLAIVLPVAATILAALITAGVPALVKAWDQSDLRRPSSSLAVHSQDHTEVINNTAEKARLVKLGQLVQVDANQERWFRFVIDDIGAARLTITSRNLYGAGGTFLHVYNGKRAEITWYAFGSGEEVRSFISPQPDDYYIKVDGSAFIEFKVAE
jgi:hypothetical protein